MTLKSHMLEGQNSCGKLDRLTHAVRSLLVSYPIVGQLFAGPEPRAQGQDKIGVLEGHADRSSTNGGGAPGGVSNGMESGFGMSFWQCEKGRECVPSRIDGTPFGGVPRATAKWHLVRDYGTLTGHDSRTATPTSLQTDCPATQMQEATSRITIYRPTQYAGDGISSS